EGKSEIKKAAGLILTNHGTISGVDVINGSINNIGKKANAAGYVLSNEEDGVIENCFLGMNTKNLNIKSGFVGTNLGKITKCSTAVSVNSKDIAGGFCGSNSGEINDCKAEGSVKAKASNGITICGGFIAENSGIIKNCSSTGKVDGQEFAGGFAGINSDNGKISSCKATCDVKSHTYIASINCGGFVGLDAGKIEDCSFDGKVDGCVDSEKVVGIAVGVTVAVILTIAGICFVKCFVKCFVALNKAKYNYWKFVNRDISEECNSYCDLMTAKDNLHKLINIFGFLFVVAITASGATAGLTVGLTAGRKCANIGAFCGVNVGEISKCSVNNSLIKAKSMYNKHNICGGFVGINGETGTIKDSVATGNEISNKTYTGGHLGGFAGENSGKIENGTTKV
ncbi:MAG: hypothetical protein K2I60_03605, partial [Oscillospiraceae bacterium]|nr:hypothetical protein [Oscillospiraceae bacterium]